MRPVNLLPENLRPRERSQGGSGGAYAVLGVLGLLLVGVVLYVVTANQITSRKADTEELRAETYAADQRAGALARFGEFQEMKEVRMASVALLATGRFDWERMARELARVLPSDVWVTELSATATGEAAASGGSSTSGSSTPSGSPSSGASSAGAGAGEEQGPSLSITGCAPTQTAVAETKVRLRRLHQAQEVTLKKSERGDDQAATGGPAPSAGAPAPGAGTAAPAPGAGAGATAPDGCGATRGRPNYEFEVAVTLAPTPDPTVGGGSVPRSLGGGA